MQINAQNVIRIIESEKQSIPLSIKSFEGIVVSDTNGLLSVVWVLEHR